MFYFCGLHVQYYDHNTVDWEYFAGSKVASAKYSMSFNFVNLALCEIILTRKFSYTEFSHYARVAKHDSVRNGILHPRLSRLWAAMIREDLLGTIQCCRWIYLPSLYSKLTPLSAIFRKRYQEFFFIKEFFHFHGYSFKSAIFPNKFQCAS